MGHKPLVANSKLTSYALPLLQINITSWPSNIQSPVVLINRVLLIKIDLEELVMRRALEVLVPIFNQITFHWNGDKIQAQHTN